MYPLLIMEDMQVCTSILCGGRSVQYILNSFVLFLTTLSVLHACLCAAYLVF